MDQKLPDRTACSTSGQIQFCHKAVPLTNLQYSQEWPKTPRDIEILQPTYLSDHIALRCYNLLIVRMKTHHEETKLHSVLGRGLH